jgi:lysophospholipid acyltransferase (LPLAT)-like uncharacterized protein
LKIDRGPGRWLIALGFQFLKLWANTLRYEVDDRANFRNAPNDLRVIFAVWHNRLFLFPYAMRRFLPDRRGAGLVSSSRDGLMVSQVVTRFGFEVVQGSSSRKGASAMLQLAEILSHGRDVTITPDGPRGPVYEVSPGVIFLAQKTGAPVVAWGMEFSKCWRLKNWDRFIVPRPFSKVRIILGAPHRVEPTATDEEFEAERLRLQKTMRDLVERY